MALQSDAIESRLEGLKLDDRRKAFDSQLRAIRLDSQADPAAANRAAKAAKKADPEQQIAQVVTLLEELSRRIDGLEKKDRALADEMRQRARVDRRRRSMYLAGAVAATGFLATGWMLRWF